MRYFLVLVWICSPSPISGFGVQVEGVIDLGPNWNYKYNLSPLRTTELFKELPMVSYSQEVRKDNELNTISTRNENDQMFSLPKKNELRENNDSGNNLYTVTQITYNIRENIPTEELNNESDVQSEQIKENLDKKPKIKKKLHDHDDVKSKESDTDVSNDEDKESLRDSKNKKIKKDGNITDRFHDFTMHVYKQALKVWENMLKITNSEEIKSIMRVMKMHFVKKFGDFIKQSKKHKLKTKLGPQKFILNTIDTCNKIMQRLINTLSTYENSVRGKSKSINVFQRELDKEKHLEFSHACKKFKICRTNDNFSDYLIELINVILETDNTKIKQAADSLTEVVKTNDFTQTIDHITQDRLRKRMADIELWDPFVVKAMFVILRNVLSHTNQPIVIMDAVDQEVANKTVAFHEIINVFNKNVYRSVNIKNWNKIKEQLEKWRDGTRKEVQSVFQSLIQQIKKGIEKVNSKTAQELNKNINIILKPISKIFGK